MSVAFISSPTLLRFQPSRLRHRGPRKVPATATRADNLLIFVRTKILGPLARRPPGRRSSRQMTFARGRPRNGRRRSRGKSSARAAPSLRADADFEPRIFFEEASDENTAGIAGGVGSVVRVRARV